MRLEEVSKNLDKFRKEKLIDYFEKCIEFAIRNTVNQDKEYYYSKKYAKNFICMHLDDVKKEKP